MRAVVQRVDRASVTVEGSITGQIDKGLLVLLGVAEGDTEKDLAYIVDKVCGLRIFEDEAGKMNLSVQDVGGSILAVSQFTLCGDCRKGKRPNFTRAAKGDQARELYKYFVDCCRGLGVETQTGEFGADMKVDLLNDGPVTIMLDTDELIRKK